MNEHQRKEHRRTACRAADQEWRAAGEAPRNPSPEALALAERAARQQDDESEVPACHAGQDVSRYPAQAGSSTWPAADTTEAPGSERESDRLYRVVHYYDSWLFHSDSRIPHGSKSRRRTDTFRTLGPVEDRLARANGLARYQRRNGGNWSAFRRHRRAAD